MIGAIICAGVLMVFCAVCLIIVLTLRAHDRALAKIEKAAESRRPLLIIDPERSDLALNENGQLVATPQDGGR